MTANIILALRPERNNNLGNLINPRFILSFKR